jgi:putative ABC transport system permease protein
MPVYFMIEIIRLGLSNLRLHLLRSVLTALGIIFGVLAVIVMSSLGEGSKRDALAQIERLGAKNIIIRSQRPPETQNQQQGQQRGFVSRFGVTRADLAVIQENFPDAEAIVPLKEVGAQIVREGRRRTSQAYGTTPDLARVANLRVASGRYLTEADMERRAAVCVIGAEIARMFFPLEDPIGKTLRIDTRPFTVVGVLAPIGLAAGAGTALVGRDLNLDVHIPMATAREYFGDLVIRGTSGSVQAFATEVSEIYLTIREQERVIADADRLRLLLKHRRPGMNDVSIIVPYELLETARKTRLRYNLIFGAIAAISLLVGGIGIMNIMLASVTERIREIGIRRALGATRRHIMSQFLVETGVLSAIGGLIGVGVGISASILVGRTVREMPTALTLWSILVSFAVAVATGLIFGLYPARRAAAADPIEALRHD